MKQLVKQTREYQESENISFRTNQELREYVDKRLGLIMLLQRQLNQLRSLERQIMMP